MSQGTGEAMNLRLLDEIKRLKEIPLHALVVWAYMTTQAILGLGICGLTVNVSLLSICRWVFKHVDTIISATL